MVSRWLPARCSRRGRSPAACDRKNRLSHPRPPGLPQEGRSAHVHEPAQDLGLLLRPLVPLTALLVLLPPLRRLHQPVELLVQLPHLGRGRLWWGGGAEAVHNSRVGWELGARRELQQRGRKQERRLRPPPAAAGVRRPRAHLQLFRLLCALAAGALHAEELLRQRGGELRFWALGSEPYPRRNQVVTPEPKLPRPNRCCRTISCPH